MGFVPNFIWRDKIVIYDYFNFKFIGQLQECTSGLTSIMVALFLMLALFLCCFFLFFSPSSQPFKQWLNKPNISNMGSIDAKA